jgi:Arc/MetJ-type ribon-helix-helix transcriptional regulator
MATEKLTVAVEAASIRKLDSWVREGRYPNRSKAAQAALDLLERRNRLPTLDEALEAYRAQTPQQRAAWDAELSAIDSMLAANAPPLPPWDGPIPPERESDRTPDQRHT